ncbi:MAG: dethiobiotin synthase [Methylacidiphilales bacterium]|nr:dethiobiotin synthase [Candidatus Methylacidiphilales bacterium]
MPGFFITGTDTGVGKTWFTCWLVRAWRAQGRTAAALKPISTGDREDGLRLRAASGDALSLDEINPLYFREPAAPLLAARAENRSIDFAALNQGIQAMRARFSHLAVEGIGGWRVPLAPGYDVRDWARDLGLPVVVVARGSLGTLNHTQLTVDSVRAAGLDCAGVVVNAGPEETAAVARPLPNLDLARSQNVALLRDLLGLPVLEFDRRVQASGHVPLWLGGEEI